MSARKVIACLLIGGFLGWWLNPNRAHAAPVPSHPYTVVTERAVEGGHVHRFVNEDDAEAWIDRNRGKHWRYHSPFPSLPQCKTEDQARLCKWDAQANGNGTGVSFWVDYKGCAHYRDWRSIICR